MKRKLFLSLFSTLVILITITSVNQWSRLPTGNTFVIWAISFSLLCIILWNKTKYFRPSNKKDYFIVTLYFVWMVVGVVRGIFVAENYWEWKQWASGSLALSLPVFVYVFSCPKILSWVLKEWVRYALPLFFILIFVISSVAYHFYLGPVLLLACFLPLLPLKWRYLFAGLLLLMVFVDLGARSQVIKALAALILTGAVLIHQFIPIKVLKFVHWLFYIVPIVLLFLGISGRFNILQDVANNNGKYIERKIVDGKIVEEDLGADTRTFIYVEVIQSALKHGYAIWGRTPSRGNDSVAFGALNAEELKTGRYERYRNEVCFPNIFTWLGIIGMVLYCLIYLKSSYLAIYRSSNIYLKLLGVFIAFRFLFGWIEDANRFDIANISLWMMIAMGFSEKFRSMTNRQFKFWVRSIFGSTYSFKTKDRLPPFTQYQERVLETQ